MRLLVLSDLHIEFGTFDVPKDVDYDIAILAGDIGVPGKKAIQWAKRESTFGRAKAVIFLAGNHEFYGTVMQRQRCAMRDACVGSRVHFLDCDEVILDGVRFLGCTLWTDFALSVESPNGRLSDTDYAMDACRKVLSDYQVIRRQVGEDRDGAIVRTLRPEDTLSIHRAHRAWLRAALLEPFDGPTVVITHHAPHRQSLASDYEDDWLSAAYVSELPDEFFTVPTLWVHGHTHTSFEYRVENCRVVCNPRGYLSGFPATKGIENRQFDARLIIEV
jgi:Icc-related predicted phosphoesterase